MRAGYISKISNSDNAFLGYRKHSIVQYCHFTTVLEKNQYKTRQKIKMRRCFEASLEKMRICGGVFLINCDISNSLLQRENCDKRTPRAGG
jgi:hypothetical protein